MNEKIEFKNPRFKKMVYEKLGKNQNEELEVSELDVIFEISINKDDYSSEYVNIIEELSYLKNLKKCSIINFDLFDKDFEVINKLSDLIYLEFVSCNFFNKLIQLKNEKVLTLAFERCFLDNLKQTKEMKKLRLLRVVNFGDVDLEGIENLNSLVELYVLNSNVYNAEAILKSENLLYVNFSGSKKIDEETVKMINKKFALTYDDVYVEIEGDGEVYGNGE